MRDERAGNDTRIIKNDRQTDSSDELVTRGRFRTNETQTILLFSSNDIRNCYLR